MEEDKQEASSMPLVPIESFSYSWLVNFPSLEPFTDDDDHHQTYEDSPSSSSSFIEMDPRLPPSRRFFINKAHESSFKFDNLDKDHSLVHADELFHNGYVMPYRTKATSAATEKESEPRIETRDVKRKSPSSCKTVVLKYLDFLMPLCRRLKRCRSSGSARSIGVTTLSSRSRVHSDETPRISFVDDYYWRRSCDSESSIYEAVLHCKKSFEMRIEESMKEE